MHSESRGENMVMEPPRRELKHLMKLGIRKANSLPISISTCVWRYCLAPLLLVCLPTKDFAEPKVLAEKALSDAF